MSKRAQQPNWLDDLETGTAKLFRAKLAKAKISQLAFGLYIDRTPRTITRWASGTEGIPAYAWIALDKLLSYEPKHRKEIIDGLEQALDPFRNEQAKQARRRRQNMRVSNVAASAK